MPAATPSASGSGEGSQQRRGLSLKAPPATKTSTARAAMSAKARTSLTGKAKETVVGTGGGARAAMIRAERLQSLTNSSKKTASSRAKARSPVVSKPKPKPAETTAETGNARALKRPVVPNKENRNTLLDVRAAKLRKREAELKLQRERFEVQCLATEKQEKEQKRELERLVRRLKDVEAKVKTTQAATRAAVLEVAEVKRKAASEIFAEQEETLSCPICYEIMACPYMINTANCGHTLCASCCLQIYFEPFCDNCQVFHEDPECPTCKRSMLSVPPWENRIANERAFLPNRAMEGLVEAQVKRLTEFGVEGWETGGVLRRAYDNAVKTCGRVMKELMGNWMDVDGADLLRLKQQVHGQTRP